MLKSTHLLLAVSIAIGTSQSLRANFEIGIHGNGSGGTPDGGTVGFPYTQTLTGTDSGLLTQVGSGDGNGNHLVVTTSEVIAGQSFGTFATMYSHAESDRAGTFVPAGEASSIVLWQDVVTLSGSEPLPSSIRLRFQVQGSAVSELIANNNQAQTFNSFSARGTSTPANFQGNFNTSLYVENPLIDDQFADTKTSYEFGRSSTSADPATQNWDSFASQAGGAFTGEFSLDVSLDTSLNAYDWAVLFSAYAESGGGSATTTISSLSLIGVTDTFDIALDDFVVDFDSGRTIGPAAESGDFDDDGDVDGLDFLSWQRGESDNPLSPADLTLWQSSYGPLPPPIAASSAIPEPTTAMLLILGLAVGGLRARSREN